jgi:hypothetical protein
MWAKLWKFFLLKGRCYLFTHRYLKFWPFNFKSISIFRHNRNTIYIILLLIEYFYSTFWFYFNHFAVISRTSKRHKDRKVYTIKQVICKTGSQNICQIKIPFIIWWTARSGKLQYICVKFSIQKSYFYFYSLPEDN